MILKLFYSSFHILEVLSLLHFFERLVSYLPFLNSLIVFDFFVVSEKNLALISSYIIISYLSDASWPLVFTTAIILGSIKWYARIIAYVASSELREMKKWILMMHCETCMILTAASNRGGIPLLFIAYDHRTRYTHNQRRITTLWSVIRSIRGFVYSVYDYNKVFSSFL